MAARRAREAVTRRTIAPLPPKLLTLVFRSLAVAHLHTGGLILGRIYQDLSTFNKSVYISTAKSRCPNSIQQRTGPGTKSIAVIANRSWYNINFTGVQLYRDKSELIRIPGLVPLIFVGFC